MPGQMKLQQRQAQNLAPQLVHSLQYLQMNVLQLSEHLEEFMLENPLLEEDETRIFSAAAADDSQREPDFERAEPETLYEHLTAQFDSSLFCEDDLDLVSFIAAHLDHAGYLTVSADEIARQTGRDPEIVDYAVSYIQTLDPAGVGARDLTECLTIQLERLGYSSPIYRAIISGNLELVARGHYGSIAKKIGCPVQEVTRACAVIRSLNPKPASAFGGERPNYIVPDILVAVRDGTVTAHLTDTRYNALHISPYYARLARQEIGGEASSYLQEKLAQAKWVLEAIELRKKTLQSLVNLVVEVQKPFFLSGGGITPLTYKEAARHLDIHESTVSRAVQGKTVECSRGLFPLRFFFSNAVGSAQNVSKNDIKTRLKQLIDSENKEAPLSDADITRQLSDEGIKVSRRALAKYRSEMDIPGAFARKRQ